MHRRREKQKPVLPISTSRSEKSKRETRCLTWSNLALGALIPLSIGIATVVVTLLQQQVDDHRQKQEKQLDDRRYDQERLVDDRRYFLDQLLANLTREKDFEIEEQRRQQEQRQADDLHFQLIFKSYIEDISNVLFKSNQSFADEEKKLQYISSKTLVVLDELDSTRKTRVFQFLHKNQLLPQVKASSNTVKSPLSLDLISANLANIFLHSSSFNRFQFEKLALLSVDLTNASFIACYFLNGAVFSGSAMDEAKFSRSHFLCPRSFVGNEVTLGKTQTSFISSTLKRASFDAMYMCGVRFEEANLWKANFSSTLFQHGAHFIGTNLTEADFRNIQTSYPVTFYFFNSNLRGALFDNNLFQELTQLDYLKMNNIILPNNSWLIDKTNLIVNGNAENNVNELFLCIVSQPFINCSFFSLSISAVWLPGMYTLQKRFCTQQFSQIQILLTTVHHVDAVFSILQPVFVQLLCIKNVVLLTFQFFLKVERNTSF